MVRKKLGLRLHSEKTGKPDANTGSELASFQYGRDIKINARGGSKR